MKLELFYFDISHAIKEHDWIIEHSGGLHGQREIGLLESALEHIQNDMYYPSFEEKLKHLVYAVNKFHPFSDGNKRIGTFLFVLFLQMNGLLDQLHFDNKTLVALALLTAASDPAQKDLLVRLITNLLADAGQ